MIPGIAEREAPFGNVGLHNIHTAPALSGRFVVLVPLRPRRGGGGVVDGWGRLRRPRPAPLPPFSTLAWDSTRRCAPPHPGDASVPTPPPRLSRPYETSTLSRWPDKEPTPESPGVGESLLCGG